MAIERQEHWQTVYSSKGEDQVSWFQEEPQPSMDLLRLIGATPAMAVLDIGVVLPDLSTIC
ncbi:hypothetical protein [Devosia rhizoryzae]|uniref:hypothetical protein n=1 Tax=Devosia rhizoryzae TaxID=2774137 RepID=UPI002D7ED0C7|nr:hypothetical protein [Devosia rhizoryzae]